MKRAPEAAALLARALSGDATWLTAVEADDLDAVAEAAAQQGVGALVWGSLAGGTGEAERIRTLLAPGARAAAARELFVARELHAVTQALAGAGIPVLITKGTALAYTLYDQPWQRPRTDTDVLTPEEHVAAAGAVLSALGYVRSDALSTGTYVSHQIAYERTDPHGVHHVVDLHWKMTNPQVLADALPFEYLIAGARQAPRLGPSALVPSPVDATMLACVHRLAHHQGDERLIWLYDIHRLASVLSDDDWGRLEETARERRLAGMCLDGLRAARALFNTSFPRPAESALEAAAPSEPASVYTGGRVTQRDVLMSDLRVIGTWGGRVRLLREHVFPPAAFMRQRYNAHPGWPLPALYLHRLLTGASRWIRP